MDICGRGKAIPGKEEKVQRPWGQVKLSTKTTFSESVSRSVVSDSAPLSVGFPSKDTGVHFYSLLQGIFPPQGSNPRLPHYRQMLYHLSHQGNPFRDPLKPLKVMPQHFRVEFPLPGGPPGSSVFPDDRGTHGSSWAVQWLKPDIPNVEARVRSLVGELRSHMVHGATKSGSAVRRQRVRRKSSRPSLGSPQVRDPKSLALSTFQARRSLSPWK